MAPREFVGELHLRSERANTTSERRAVGLMGASFPHITELSSLCDQLVEVLDRVYKIGDALGVANTDKVRCLRYHKENRERLGITTTKGQKLFLNAIRALRAAIEYLSTRSEATAESLRPTTEQIAYLESGFRLLRGDNAN